MRPPHDHLSSRLKSALTAAAGVLLLWTAMSGAALAQRSASPPPEPSQRPWISAEGVNGLQNAIALYRKIASSGGWPVIPGKVTLKVGQSDPNVANLRRRLQITGDVGAASSDPSYFDQDLESGVKRYQSRNGLEPSGVVYGVTQRLLNVPAEEAVKQLEVNLARMQELLSRLAASPRYIVMNAASFELQGISAGAVRVASRVISGKRATPTPTVSATVQAVNILPYWFVPGNIAKDGLIPALRKDPAYFYKERIRVFSSFGGAEIDPAHVNWWGPEAERYTFRQDPGPQNALGVLRFDMPNKHIVYMHDTPMKSLFNAYERAFSHGCVRTQNFIAVADWVLAGQGGWSRPGIEAAIASGKQTTIKLASPVPVHFIYLTAWVDGGVVQFRNDLYNRDNSQPVAAEALPWQAVTTSVTP